MPSIKDWIEAFRLRTLPLAFSCIFLGASLAYYDKVFKLDIFLLALLTTLFLQVLSNLANDLGDTQNGADNEDRGGPKRAVQTGVITTSQMKFAVWCVVGLSLISGVSLLIVSFGFEKLLEIALFFLLGISSIIAAIKYTMGRSPYGYSGFGDLFVFLFFGLIGVMGSNFLFSESFNYNSFYLSISMGLLSTGVLNINNIRDIKSDFKAGKITIPVRLGAHYAALYHLILIVGAMGFALLFNYKNNLLEIENLLYVLSFPLLGFNAYKIAVLTPCQMNPYLKQLALSSFVFSLLFAVSINL